MLTFLERSLLCFDTLFLKKLLELELQTRALVEMLAPLVQAAPFAFAVCPIILLQMADPTLRFVPSKSIRILPGRLTKTLITTCSSLLSSSPIMLETDNPQLQAMPPLMSWPTRSKSS
jgi:hypothetical protein